MKRSFIKWTTQYGVSVGVLAILVMNSMPGGVQAAPPISRKVRIVLDPGHGGIDRGATSGSINESELVLQVTSALKRELQKNLNYEVLLTRTRDEYVGLEARSKMAARNKADLFVSLHLNSNPSSNAHGTEFYIMGQMAEDEESMFLAHQENQDDAIEKEGEPKASSDLASILLDLQRNYNTHRSLDLAREMKKNWDLIVQNHTRIRQAPFHVLAFAQMPSVLIELGFLSNPKEAAWLVQANSGEKMAKSLALSIQNYIERIDKEDSARHITKNAY